MTITLKSATVALLTVGLIAYSAMRNAGSSMAAAAGSITSTVSMSTARAAHTATLLPNGKVLITGGMERETVSLASAELYDPVTGKFTNTGNMTTTRSGHKAVLLRTGKVLVLGGINHEDGLLASAELYDPATGTFTLTGSMKEKGGGLATVLADGRVLVASSTAELYDPVNGSFTATGKMATQPSTATLLRNGKVLLTGSGNSAELYDPGTGFFTHTTSMTVQREKHSATLLPDGKVLITGGMDRNGPEGRSISAEIYDPAKGSFTAIGNMSMARFKHGSATVVLPNGKVLIAGGGQRAEVFDPPTNTFSIASGSLDAARFFATATLLPSGKVLVLGGYARGVVCTAGAWIYQS